MVDDAKTAKANAKAAKAHAKALRPWYKKKRWIFSIIIVALIGIAVAGSSGSDKNATSTDNATQGTTQTTTATRTTSQVKTDSNNGAHPPTADVALGTCVTDSSIGSATAHLVITNHSSGRSNYLVDVEFQDGSGAQIGSGTAIANDVDAAQIAKTDAVDFVTGKATKCVIKDVQRYAS